MKILFFNRFFHPDSSATSQILSDLAFHLASRHEVHVVTSRSSGAEAAEETTGGVRIHRVAWAPPGPHGLCRRALAYAAYYAGARDALRRLASRGDVVVAKTDPPMLSAALAGAALARRARLVVCLQDLFPEVAREYGVAGLRGPFGAWLQHRRDLSLAAAETVVAISAGMADRVRAGGVPPERVRVIENWADAEEISPDEAAGAMLRRSLGLEGRFVVGYSGNLGRVHEFDTLLSAAALLAPQREIAFAIIGRGPRLGHARARAERERLRNVVFVDRQPRQALRQAINLPDVHLVVLKPEFEGLVLPSKLYGVLAAGKPTLFVGDPRGETATVLREAGAGLALPTGDAAGLAAAIEALRSDVARRRAMGHRARQHFLAHNDKTLGFRAWEALLEGLREQA